jgi:SH3-like domain-containing protein
MTLLSIALGFAAAAALSVSAASAQEAEEPGTHVCPTRSQISMLEVPRFVSLKADEVRGRRGPSTNHPVRWVYRRESLPVKIVGEVQDWREIEDPAGDRVWVHASLLTGARTLMTLRATTLRTRPQDDAAEEAAVEAGAILALRTCRDGWCQVSAQGFRGFVPMDAVWGLFPWERDDSDAAASGCEPAQS